MAKPRRGPAWCGKISPIAAERFYQGGEMRAPLFEIWILVKACSRGRQQNRVSGLRFRRRGDNGPLEGFADFVRGIAQI